MLVGLLGLHITLLYAQHLCNKYALVLIKSACLRYTHIAMILAVRYRFSEFPHIVVDVFGSFYQLAHCDNKYTKKVRKLPLTINNGVTSGYRINRKFVSLKQLRKLAFKVNENIPLRTGIDGVPF